MVAIIFTFLKSLCKDTPFFDFCDLCGYPLRPCGKKNAKAHLTLTLLSLCFLNALYINIIQNTERRFGCLGIEIGTNLIFTLFKQENNLSS